MIFFQTSTSKQKRVIITWLLTLLEDCKEFSGDSAIEAAPSGGGRVRISLETTFVLVSAEDEVMGGLEADTGGAALGFISDWGGGMGNGWGGWKGKRAAIIIWYCCQNCCCCIWFMGPGIICGRGGGGKKKGAGAEAAACWCAFIMLAGSNCCCIKCQHLLYCTFTHTILNLDCILIYYKCFIIFLHCRWFELQENMHYNIEVCRKSRTPFRTSYFRIFRSKSIVGVFIRGV